MSINEETTEIGEGEDNGTSGSGKLFSQQQMIEMADAEYNSARLESLELLKPLGHSQKTKLLKAMLRFPEKVELVEPELRQIMATWNRGYNAAVAQGVEIVIHQIREIQLKQDGLVQQQPETTTEET